MVACNSWAAHLVLPQDGSNCNCSWCPNSRALVKNGITIGHGCRPTGPRRATRIFPAGQAPRLSYHSRSPTECLVVRVHVTERALAVLVGGATRYSTRYNCTPPTSECFSFYFLFSRSDTPQSNNGAQDKAPREHSREQQQTHISLLRDST